MLAKKRAERHLVCADQEHQELLYHEFCLSMNGNNAKKLAVGCKFGYNTASSNTIHLVRKLKNI